MKQEFKNLENKINNNNSNINNNNISIKYYDDERYEGELKNGKREGKGIYYYKNGDRYE